MDLAAGLVQDIVNAEHVCVFTGAGISAESGVPTFRGAEGHWRSFRPEELATPEAFVANPRLVWEWYQWRRDLLTKVRPNTGHLALAYWESLCQNFTLITQNVDGLHRAAGSRRIIELHGNIHINRCFNCGVETSLEFITFTDDVPCCSCGGMLRPGVVWFGEALPQDAVDAARRAAQACDLFVTVGTSAVVYPAAALPGIAQQAGAVVIEVNIEETPFTSQAKAHVRGKAGDILPGLVALYEKTHPHSNASIGNP